MKAISRIRNYRAPLMIVVFSVCLIAYMYLNPPLSETPLLSPRLFSDFLPAEPGGTYIAPEEPGAAQESSLEGSTYDMSLDLAFYASRFLLSFLFMGGIPLLAAFALGFKLQDAGLSWTPGMFRWKAYWFLFPLFILVTAASAFNEEMSGFYPWSAALVDLSIQVSPLYFVSHGFLYLFLYYLPWEILFRGLMVIPLLNYLEQRDLDNDRANKGARNRGLGGIRLVNRTRDGSPLRELKDPVILALAMLQILPTVLVHLPHPVSETFATIIFGFIAAVVVIRTRSVYPVILLHWAAGISLDLMIVLKQAFL